MGDILHLLSLQRSKKRKKNSLQKINWDQNSHSYRFVHDKIYYIYFYTYRTGFMDETITLVLVAKPRMNPPPTLFYIEGV